MWKNIGNTPIEKNYSVYMANCERIADKHCIAQWSEAVLIVNISGEMKGLC